jgi:hypothetical protein
MVTEPDSSTLDLQTAMRGMDVADEIRRQYGRIPADPEEVDREKVEAKLLERYETLEDKADPFAVAEVIDAYLAEPNRFRPPRGGAGLTLARWYVRRRQIARKAAFPLLAAALVAALVVSAAEKRTRRAEADAEVLVGELFVIHGALEARLEAFSESPQVLEMDADVRTVYYDHLDQATDQLDAARPFLEQYAPEGDAGAAVTAENREDAKHGAEGVRAQLASADGFLEDARDVLAEEEGLAKVSEDLDRMIATARAAELPAAVAQGVERAYAEGKTHVGQRQLPQARYDESVLAGLLDGALELSRLDAEAERLHGSIQAVAVEDAAAARGRELFEEARRLAEAGDVPELRLTVDRLADLGTRLDREIRLVIVGGVWRYENRSPQNRNYYLRIQALDAYGNPLEMSIRNEETGQTERVREWGERVPKEVYDRVGADKADDSIIDDDLFGTKQRGYLNVERQLPDVGQITRW